MGFLDETALLLGSGDNSTTFMCIKGNSAVVVEGYKKIIELSSKSIKLLCEDNMRIELAGTNMVIGEISHREISISGSFSGITFAKV